MSVPRSSSLREPAAKMACRAAARGASEGWWAREDSNLQPSGYEPLALTIELRARAGRNRRPSETFIIIAGISSILPAEQKHRLLAEQIPEPPRHFQPYAATPGV